jgi:hypothetical protein
MADEDTNNDAEGGQDQQDPLIGGHDKQGPADTSRQDHEEDVKQEAEDKGKTLSQAEVDKIVAERVARERKKFADYEDLKKKASEYDKFQDSQKTELQKKEDQIAAQAIELQKYKVSEIRQAAAKAAGLDSDLAEFITAADPGEAEEQAKKLAERFKASAKQPDFKQGARQTPPPQRSRDELLRNLAGFSKQ